MSIIAAFAQLAEELRKQRTDNSALLVYFPHTIMQKGKCCAWIWKYVPTTVVAIFVEII